MKSCDVWEQKVVNMYSIYPGLEKRVLPLSLSQTTEWLGRWLAQQPSNCTPSKMYHRIWENEMAATSLINTTLQHSPSQWHKISYNSMSYCSLQHSQLIINPGLTYKCLRLSIFTFSIIYAFTNVSDLWDSIEI